MVNEEIRFAIIGCGRISGKHGSAVASLADQGARFVAACDMVESRAHHFVEEFGGTAYTDYHEMIARNDIDIVSICLPSGMHSAVGQEVARAGKHVLVEKPIALNLVDADALIKTCENEHITLGVVLQNRFNPPMQELRRVIDEGRLGRPLLANVTVRWYRPQEYYEDGWHGTWAMDGGALMNQCIHHIDAMIWLMGEVESVFAYTGTLAHQMETEDTGVVAVRFKSGALGVIEGSTITYPQNLEGSLAIFGTQGSVKVGGTALNRRVIWKIEGQLEHEANILAMELVDPPTVYGFSHREQIEEMINAVRENRIPSTHGREARKSLEVVSAIYESVRCAKEIRL
jgi:UDP-N-acetyl-2-amino-2-deoxyglucuronate dehydrogenase